MTGESFDDRYVGFREHAAAMQRTDAELARLRERQATTEATLLHEVAGVRADVAEMKQLMLRPPPPPVDHTALAIQRALDDLGSRRVTGGGSLPAWLLILAGAGVAAFGYAVRFFIGG